MRSLFAGLALFSTIALSQNPKADTPKLNMPGPELQNLMLGTFTIKVEYAPDEKMPKGAFGSGTEVWHLGPGGYSVTEEYREHSPVGDTEGLAVMWWDEQAQGRRFIWCDNTSPQSCSPSKGVAKWEGNSLVYTEEVEIAGKKVIHKETFSDITPTSFAQTLKGGPVGGELKTVVTIHATKLAAD